MHTHSNALQSIAYADQHHRTNITKPFLPDFQNQILLLLGWGVSCIHIMAYFCIRALAIVIEFRNGVRVFSVRKADDTKRSRSAQTA